MEVISVGRLKHGGLCRHHVGPIKPLHGYTFYIDVEDQEEEDTVEILEGRITSLGGTISRLLSKTILYFISGGVKSKRTRRSGRFLKQNETRAKKTKLQNITYPCTALDRARIMGLTIFTVAKVIKWVKEIEKRKMYFSPTKIKNDNGCSHNLPPANMDMDNDNVMQLQSLQTLPIPSLSHFKVDTSKNDGEELMPPFIKVEDKGKAYEPQYLEFSSFPLICFEGKVPRSPFQKIHLNGTAESIENNSELASSNPCNYSHNTLTSTSKYSKSGYCDFCEAFFRFRDRHIRSKKHQTNIPYENFQKLDELITNCGSFNDFLKTSEEKRKKRELKTMEQKRKLRVFLKTLEGAKQSCDFFRNSRVELNELVECNGKKKDTGFTTNSGGKIIR